MEKRRWRSAKTRVGAERPFAARTSFPAWYISQKPFRIFFTKQREAAADGDEEEAANLKKREGSPELPSRVSLGPRAGADETRGRAIAGTRGAWRVARVTMSKGSKRSDQCLSRSYRHGDDTYTHRGAEGGEQTDALTRSHAVAETRSATETQGILSYRDGSHGRWGSI